MAPSRIHIQQVRLEVGAPDAALARPLPERLSQLFQASLLAVLSSELTQHDLHDLLLRLPQLVLELPPVAAHRLALDLPDYLRTALRQALAALPPAPAANPAALATEGLVSLRYFLLNGRLPWSTNAVDFDLDTAIDHALRQQPAALRALLAQVGRWLPPRQRLAQQLALPTLGQLLGLVEPTHAAFVQAYLRDTLLAHYHRPLLAASTVTLRRVLHELALADLLGRQTQFNRSAFVERQLRQLATRYNLSYPALLRQLAAAYALVSLPVAARAATLPGIIQGLQKAQAAAEVSHAATSQLLVSGNVVSATDNYAALVYYLRHGSLPPVGPPLTQAALVATLAAVLRRGRLALGRLGQQVGGLGPAALALAGALPPAQQQLLLHPAPRPTLPPPGGYGSHLESRPERPLPTPLLSPETYSLSASNPRSASSFEMARRATLGRLLRPAKRFVPAPAYELAGTGSLTEAQAAVFRYLLAGGTTATLAWLRPLMRWVVARQPAAVALLLRRQAATSAVWPRLLAVANGATLHLLLAGPVRAGRRAGDPAGLATLTTGAVGSPRLAAFLKTLYLIAHFGPAGALSEAVVWQLAATQGLPRRATWHKLSGLTPQWPALAAAPFAGLLRAAPPTEPPGAGPQAAPALAAQNLLLHYLRHGQAPWWQPAPVAAKTLGRTLQQLARQPAVLHGFLRQHAHEATVQQQLARLADFSLLHALLPTPGVGRGRRQVARPALAALDRYLGQAAGGARLGQFLREAYLAFASAAPTSAAAALAP
ncbi:contractile injection system tape measure protein, partial [Hymenobacter bucti]